MSNMSIFRSDKIDADQLFQAWKTALSSDDAEIRRLAWHTFPYYASDSYFGTKWNKDVFTDRFKAKVPELLKLGTDLSDKDANLRSTLNAWMPFAQMGYGATVYVGNKLIIKEKISHRSSEYHPPAVTSAVTSFDRVHDVKVARGDDGKTTISMVYIARGPAGRYEGQIKLRSKDGVMLGTFDIVVNELDKLK
jgi:hypothetical protein